MALNSYYRILNRLLFACFLLVQVTGACTTFYFSHGNRIIFGNNYDWDLGDGLVIVNKRGVSKTAINYNNPARWVSNYGSVTFNQYGREFPTAGMNEKGLTVGLMWMQYMEYPPPDSRPEIDNLQWMQYIPDNFSTVEELMQDTAIRVAPVSSATIHYLIGDARGGCVCVEFVNGERVCYHGRDLPAQVLTNSTYASSVRYLEQHDGFGGTKRIPSGNGTYERFVRITRMLKDYTPQKEKDLVTYGFDILSGVAMGSYTKWSIVYNITDRCIYFRTSHSKKIKKVALEEVHFSCGTPVRIIDINTGLSGDITKKFGAYTPKKNSTLVKSSFKKTYFLDNVPDELLERLLQLPEVFTCNR